VSTPRRVLDLGEVGFSRKLSETGLGVRIGPYDAFVQSDVTAMFAALYRLYRDYPLLDDDGPFSFHARLQLQRSWPTGRKNKVRYSVDGRVPHEDMPADQALAVFEWGLNLVIAMRSHHVLMLHAAVLERDGAALVLPAEPGSGKTTLSAALAHSDWRLLSDEFGLVALDEPMLLPVPRAMALKNESVDLIRSKYPAAELGPIVRGTRKGDVAHVKPPESSIARMSENARPRLIVFPRYLPGAGCQLTETAGVEPFMLVASNAFNYELLGEAGFRTVSKLVARSRCFRLTYSNMDEAIAILENLHAGG
jgi:HprK-related kinase A